MPRLRARGLYPHCRRMLCVLQVYCHYAGNDRGMGRLSFALFAGQRSLVTEGVSPLHGATGRSLFGVTTIHAGSHGRFVDEVTHHTVDRDRDEGCMAAQHCSLAQEYVRKWMHIGRSRIAAIAWSMESSWES